MNTQTTPETEERSASEPLKGVDDHGRNNAIAGMDNILEMVAALEVDYDRLEELKEELGSLEATRWRAASGGSELFEEYATVCEELDKWNLDNRDEYKELLEAAGECTSREDAEQRIHEDALSVEVRSGWAPIGGALNAEEYMILLTTGGPALRIRGELRNGEPYRCWLEYQDWGTPWTEYHGPNADMDTLLTYSHQFYFGE